MQLHNALPLFLDCLKKWPTLPSEEEFTSSYVKPLDRWLAPMLADFASFRGITFHQYIQSIDWAAYRAKALGLDPAFEEKRALRHIDRVGAELGMTLEGDVLLFGAFTMMDGYARFEKGTHCVFLGVDEEFGEGPYLDILIPHELTHVARESRAPVWEGFGLNPKMTHDELTKSMPVVEHLMSEGFSCYVSEVLHPGAPDWKYAYQTEESYQQVMDNRKAINDRIHRELSSPDGYYRNLYFVESYGAEIPFFSHYVWAWQWVKHLARKYGHSHPKELVARCSKDFIADALNFEL